jgi:hypothetical protein
MQIVLALLIAMIATAALFAAIEALHHSFAVLEYSLRQHTCPACGKRCYGVRTRRSTLKPWSPWRSSCCGVKLSAPGSGDD